MRFVLVAIAIIQHRPHPTLQINTFARISETCLLLSSKHKRVWSQMVNSLLKIEDSRTKVASFSKLVSPVLKPLFVNTNAFANEQQTHYECVYL